MFRIISSSSYCSKYFVIKDLDVQAHINLIQAVCEKPVGRRCGLDLFSLLSCSSYIRLRCARVFY